MRFVPRQWCRHLNVKIVTSKKTEDGNMHKLKFAIAGCGFLGNIVADAWRMAARDTSR